MIDDRPNPSDPTSQNGFAPPPLPFGSDLPAPPPPIEPPPLAPPAPGPATDGGYARSEGQRAVPTWAPPPKPGLVPLRPLGFGTLLGAPFQVLRRNPKATFGSALLIEGVIIVLGGLAVGGLVLFSVSRIGQAAASDQDAIAAGSLAIGIIASLVVTVLGVIGVALLESLLVIEVSRQIVGEKRTFGFLWRTALRRFGPLLGFFALTILAIAIALTIVILTLIAISMTGAAGAAAAFALGFVVFLGLGVVGAWLSTKLALVPCAIVLERRTLRQSIARSWRLTRGSFWKTFGILFLVSAIVSFATQLVVVPVSFLAPLVLVLVDPNMSMMTSPVTAVIVVLAVNALTLLVTLVFTAIGEVVRAGAVVLLYVDLRMRREGLDLELVRYVESGGSAGPLPDPFDPIVSR